MTDATSAVANFHRIYRQLNRVQKGNWTRLARTFSIAHANKVWAERLAKSEGK